MPESLMLKRRPGSVTAAAVLTIIYGCLFMICGLCGVGGLIMQGSMNQGLFGGGDPQQAQMQKQMQDAIERDVPAYRVVQIAIPVVGLALSLTMLIAGIGLLGMHSWARLLAVLAALLAVVFTVFQAIYQVVFVIPATSEALGAALPAAMAKGPGPAPGAAEVGKMMQMVFTMTGIVSVVLYVLIIAYLLIIVILLQRRHVRAAFAAGGLQFEGKERPDLGDENEGWRPSGPPRGPEDDTRYR